jgi:sugar phosphate isomerase/epimerase
MSDWPIGLSTGCFYQTSIFDCLESIRNGGFCMIEVCSSPGHLNYHDFNSIKEVTKYISALGMEAYSFHAPFIDVDISSPDQQHREYSQYELLTAAEAAAQLNTRYFVIHPGPDKVLSFSTEERMERMRNAAEVLNTVAKKCRQLNVGLVLENMLPHLPFGSVSDLLWILGAVDELNICTCLDTGHAVLSGDLYNVMYKLGGHMRVMHANDNNGAHDDHLEPGAGVIDWKRLLFELSEIDFHGGIVLELSGSDLRNADETLHIARQARSFIRKISRDQCLRVPLSVNRAGP